MNKAVRWVTLLQACMCGAVRRSLFRLSRRRFMSGCVALLGGMLLAGLAQAGPIQGGDILVADYLTDKLFKVDPVTGVRSVISDFSNPAQGPVNSATPGLSGVAVGQGQIFVTDLFTGIFSVDPTTGNRKLVSNFNQGAIQGVVGYDVAVDVFGRVVAPLHPGLLPSDAVVRVAPRTDTRVIVSNLSDPAQGAVSSTCAVLTNYACVINDLALERLGTILIGLTDGNTHSAIYRVDPVTGYRTLLSDFNNPAQGPGATFLGIGFGTGMTVEAAGEILINYSSFSSVLLFRINPITGNRTVLSDFGNPAQGPVCTYLYGLGVEKSGNIIVGCQGAFNNPAITDLLRVDPKTGNRVVLSDSTNPQQGPSFEVIVDLAVVPDNAGFFAPPPANSLGSPFGPAK
jgi:hypothetical protein